MIGSLIRWSIANRLLVIVIAVLIGGWGVHALRALPHHFRRIPLSHGADANPAHGDRGWAHCVWHVYPRAGQLGCWSHVRLRPTIAHERGRARVRLQFPSQLNSRACPGARHLVTVTSRCGTGELAPQVT